MYGLCLEAGPAKTAWEDSGPIEERGADPG